MSNIERVILIDGGFFFTLLLLVVDLIMPKILDSIHVVLA